MKAHDREHRHRLSAAGLPHQRHRLSREHFEVDTSHHFHRTSRELQDGGEALHRQHWLDHVDLLGTMRSRVGGIIDRGNGREPGPSRNHTAEDDRAVSTRDRRNVAGKLMDRQEAKQCEEIGLLGSGGDAEVVNR